MKTIKVIGFSVLCVFASQSFAQKNVTAPQANIDEQIENITVDGRNDLSVLEHNVFRAEEDFFMLFNELVSNQSFHINCSKENRHSFTRIKQRKCESKYQDEIAFDLNQTIIRVSDTMDPSGRWMLKLPLQGEKYREQRMMKKKQVAAMAQLVQENPELLAKLVALDEAKTKYEAAKETQQ